MTKASPLLLLALSLAGCSGGTPSDAATTPEGNDAASHAQANHAEASQSDAGQRHGHHGHHRFEAAERWAAQFEDAERDRWQRPEAVIAALGLAATDRVADIGAATGYFPVRLAAAVPQGRVWGVDIEPSMVRFLNARARREGLENLFAILGTADDPLLPEPVDLVLIVNTYHHIEARVDYFRRLRGALRESGRVAVVDYRPGDLPYGPPDSMKLSPEQVRQELEAAGFLLEHEDTELLPYQYLLIFSHQP